MISLRPRETALTGSVVDPGGDPASGFALMLLPTGPSRSGSPPQPYSRVFDNPEGRFSVSTVPAGQYHVWVHAIGQSESTGERVLLGARRENVELRQGDVTQIDLQMAPMSSMPRRLMQGFPGPKIPGRNSGRR